jgi:SAM-dependent methyltransferase
VLEHIDDDRQAMRELFRILRPGGTALLTLPINPSRADTYEDPRITDPVQREAHFTAPDHRRYYGLDVHDRLRGTGFSVETFRLPPPQEVRYGLLPTEWLIVATRPA